MQNFCYATDSYSLVMLHNYEKRILEFSHHLIPAKLQKTRKRKKSSHGKEMVLQELNTEPHEHNIINAAH